MTPGLTRIQTAEKAIADFLEAAPLGNVLQISNANTTEFIEKKAAEFQVYFSGANRQQTFKTSSDLMPLGLGEAFLDGTLQDSQTQEPLKNLLREKEVSQIDAQPTNKTIDPDAVFDLNPDAIFDLNPEDELEDDAIANDANTPKQAIAVEPESSEQPAPESNPITTLQQPTSTIESTPHDHNIADFLHESGIEMTVGEGFLANTNKTNTPKQAIAVEPEEQPKPAVKTDEKLSPYPPPTFTGAFKTAQDFTRRKPLEIIEITPEQVAEAENKPIIQAKTEAKPEPEAKIAQLKLFGNGSGAMLFEKAAEVVAEALGLEVETGSTGSRLKLESSQFDAAIAGLEAKGWTVEMVQPKETTRISLHGNNATVYGEGASHVAEKLGLTTEATEKGTAKLKIPSERVEEITALLKQGGFRPKAEEVVNTRAPKAVFREHSNGETYSVFDASAKNVAKALEREPDQTAGCRPVLQFSREEYKEVKQALKDQGFELSLKDLELKAKVATFTQDNGTIGGVITGEAAREAAAALNLETGWTKQGGNSNTSQPKLILRGVEQVDAAKMALEAQNYTVEVTELPPMKIANMSTFQDGSAALFGEPAKLAAEHLGVKTIPTRNGNVMVKVEANEISFAKAMLMEKGYEIRSQPYTPPPTKTQAPQTQSATAKPKVKAGEGR